MTHTPKYGPVGESGFSLIEAITATVIAIIAILGLAYSIGQGRALISDYQTARAARAAAQGWMETLATLAPTDSSLALGLHGRPFVANGDTLGTVQWNVTAVDDPADGLGGADADSNTLDMKSLTMTATWNTASLGAAVTYRRLFPAP